MIQKTTNKQSKTKTKQVPSVISNYVLLLSMLKK